MAKRKPKQDALPTLEPPSNKELNDAIDDYQGKKEKWMKLGKDVTEAKGVIVTLMTENNFTKYRFDDLICEYNQKRKDVIKVHSAETEGGVEE